MSIPMIACSTNNFRAGRGGQKVAYLVIHYTANNGDTARGNTQYFSRTSVAASAHYFVDEKEIVQSVQETDTAWHCGATAYKHPLCRNGNSVGVELCSRKDAKGNYYFLDATVQRAEAFVRELMKKYNIPAERVLRHFDVTGKKCPAPFVDNPKAWANFKDGLEGKDVTVQEAKQHIQEKVGLAPVTMAFLESYKYADELFLKLASAMQ